MPQKKFPPYRGEIFCPKISPLEGGIFANLPPWKRGGFFMPPKAAEGGKAKKAPKASEQAARAGQAACQDAEGCGLPQAKLWEKGAAFMAFLNASRQKQEDDKVNLVEKAAEVYPACLDMWFARLPPMQLDSPPLSRGLVLAP